MLSAGVLLIGLCLLGVHQNEAISFPDDVFYIDYGFDTTDAPNIYYDVDDWLFDLIDEPNACQSNPCFNGASCLPKSDTEFTCICPYPYVGKRCQKMKNICANVTCGHGNCVVNLNKPESYECKCNPPYYGPDCKSLPSSACEPNPCQNGATCVKGAKRFGCICPAGYTGRFCQNAPADCYEGNGESYRGTVSETEDGQECLDWNSFFVRSQGEDPITMYPDTGLESNNYCRNPDGDDKPWCYVKKQGSLQWDYCKVKKCSGGPSPTPVQPVPGSTPFSQCGKIDFGTQPTRTSRIFGGTKSFPGAHPWQLSLQAKPKGSSFEFGHICGGILLSSCWALTAAHCISNTNEFQVMLGGVKLFKQEEMDQTIPVVETIVHENYREAPDALYNDIALLRLQVTDSPYCAKETRFVRAACLPDQSFPSGKECVISGWGATESQRFSTHLLNARVFMISDQKCRTPEVYGGVLDDSMLCAGILQGGTDSCKGDSGGPLVCEHNGTHYVSGVVSWGIDCARRNKPGVYANVYSFLDWIKNKMI
ncbi:hyaluronan-binding protein 2-like [Xyrichtys novacula]|uniref:trypsin n=2 Tax=Xyrichtys novacula TaxID=13765 RepID=A0AAV1H594_XYRNO|nr:hyaluronan-binding protein 2-like [Xyrichtys novacula]